MRKQTPIYALFFALITVLTLAGHPGPSVAQLKELKLKVDGLVCSFCAYGLEKNLKKSLKGIESLDISLNKGSVEIDFKENNSVDLTKIRGIIKDSGFTLRKMLITASGVVTRDKDIFLLKIKGNKNNLYILDESPEEKFKEEQIGEFHDKKLEKILEQFAKNRTSLEVTGSVHYLSDGSLGLVIKKYSIFKEKQNEKTKR